jgi:hypothetical protein
LGFHKGRRRFLCQIGTIFPPDSATLGVIGGQSRNGRDTLEETDFSLHAEKPADSRRDSVRDQIDSITDHSTPEFPSEKNCP